MVRALFLGRFQPFHNGHYEIIHQFMEEMTDVEHLIIAVGSAKKSYTLGNPFTAGERIEMIWISLKEEWRKKCFIIPIDDVNRYGIWVSHVEELVPEFDTVIGNNPVNAKLFGDKGYNILHIDPIYRNMFKGTYIRGMMADGVWDGLPRRDEYVPKAVEEYLNEIDGVQRIRDLVISDE